MAEEIERKFLVTALPSGLDAASGDGERLRQGYLAVDGEVEVRLRLTASAATLTLKAGSGLVRVEVEHPVDPADVDALWAHTEGRRIEKVRHRPVLPDGTVVDLDVYEGALAGLVVAEVEVPDRAAAEEFVAPPWFGRELTGEKGWSNAALARRGRPDSPAPGA